MHKHYFTQSQTFLWAINYIVGGVACGRWFGGANGGASIGGQSVALWGQRGKWDLPALGRGLRGGHSFSSRYADTCKPSTRSIRQLWRTLWWPLLARADTVCRLAYHSPYQSRQSLRHLTACSSFWLACVASVAGLLAGWLAGRSSGRWRLACVVCVSTTRRATTPQSAPSLYIPPKIYWTNFNFVVHFRCG